MEEQEINNSMKTQVNNVVNPDQFIYDNRFSKKSAMWRRLFFFVIIAILVAVMVAKMDVVSLEREFIARIKIKGMISENSYLLERLEKLTEKDGLKAVILYVDSPGGQAGTSEKIYNILKSINKNSPVVTIMENMAASGGYLISLAGERIYAMNSTITGSIGVIMEIPNLSGTLEKIGVSVESVKTGALKGQPSLYKNLTPEGREVLQSLVGSFYDYFVGLVAKERGIDLQKAKKLADGRAYSAAQAIENKLIDQIGNEEDALLWLHKNKSIAKDIVIIDYDLYKKDNPFKSLAKAVLSDAINLNGSNSGLVSVYGR